MLTSEEVARLKAVENEYHDLSKKLGEFRTSMRKAGKSKDPSFLQQEEEIERKQDVIRRERDALIKKRGYASGYGEPRSWYPEPGYGPDW